ncbi:hypothetical protein LX36DRAFT_135329 [Colletotrichum falcatum]|nr:hypothetical protein LX36DRAFT_135329 [Colletotrichum falcatum]
MPLLFRFPHSSFCRFIPLFVSHHLLTMVVYLPLICLDRTQNQPAVLMPVYLVELLNQSCGLHREPPLPIVCTREMRVPGKIMARSRECKYLAAWQKGASMFHRNTANNEYLDQRAEQPVSGSARRC